MACESKWVEPGDDERYVISRGKPRLHQCAIATDAYAARVDLLFGLTGFSFRGPGLQACLLFLAPCLAARLADVQQHFFLTGGSLARRQT
jgi:hypothetical protein